MSALAQICQQLDCMQLMDRLTTSLSRFGFDPDSPSYGAKHLSEWYDLDVPAVRKLLVSYMKEFCAIHENINIFRLYVSVPSPTVLSVALNDTGRVRVYTAELCSMIVLRGILGLSLAKLGNCCESKSRCAMLENRGDFIKRKFIPQPDLMWSFGLLCDECPKKDEWIRNILGLQTISTICPRDYRGESVFQYYEAALRNDIQAVCSLAGIPSPDGKLAWQKARLLGILVSTISCKVSEAKNPPLKAATLSLLQSTQLMTFGDIDELLIILQELLKEVRSVKKPDHKKKLYCYYIPPCIPELGAIFEKSGVALVGGAAFLTAPVYRACSDDLAGYCAASWQCCILSRSTGAMSEATSNMITKDHCDGYLTGMFEFDRWLGNAHKLSADDITGRTGKPVFQCRVDFWGHDISFPRLETYAETIASLI